MRILGIDIGTNMGWCLFNTDRQLIIGVGTIDLSIKSGEGGGMRPFRCRNFIRSALLGMNPDVVVYESVNRHRGTIAGHVFGELRGVLLEECETMDPKMPLTKLSVTEWKKASVGKGNASKDDVLLWAENRDDWPIGLDSYDAADAFGVAYAYAKLEGLI